MKVTVKNWEGKNRLLQTYETDQSGRIDVEIPAVTDNRTSIRIEVMFSGNYSRKINKELMNSNGLTDHYKSILKSAS